MTNPSYVAEDALAESYLDDLSQMSDEELGEFALTADSNLDKWRQLRAYAAGELLRRRPEGAKAASFGDALVEYEESWTPFTYDLDDLVRVFRPYVSKTEWDAAVWEEDIPATVVPHAETLKLNALANKYGKLASIALESCRRREPRDPRVKIQKVEK